MEFQNYKYLSCSFSRWRVCHQTRLESGTARWLQKFTIHWRIMKLTMERGWKLFTNQQWSWFLTISELGIEWYCQWLTVYSEWKVLSWYDSTFTICTCRYAKGTFFFGTSNSLHFHGFLRTPSITSSEKSTWSDLNLIGHLIRFMTHLACSATGLWQYYHSM